MIAYFRLKGTHLLDTCKVHHSGDFLSAAMKNA